MFNLPNLKCFASKLATQLTHLVRSEDSRSRSALPPELIDHIFSFLPIAGLAQARGVCKEWNDIALNERQLRRVCVAEGWEKRDESQTWLDCARDQAWFQKTFVKGGASNRLPNISVPKAAPSEHFVEDKWAFLESKMKYSYDKLDEANILIKHIATGKTFTLTHPRDITRFYSPNETILYSLAQDGYNRIWDMETGECIAIIPQHHGYTSPFQMTHYGNILVDAHTNALRDKSFFHVRYLDHSKQDFSFKLDGEVSSIDLNGNMLAVYEKSVDGEGNDKIHLIDIEKKQFCTYNTTTSGNPSERIEVVWGGSTLFIKRYYHNGSIETWDFSKEASHKCPRPLEPLTIKH